jgi:hypothetical protein
MKLDFESLEKGINEELHSLQKDAGLFGTAGRLIAKGYNAVAPAIKGGYNAVAPEVKDWWRFGGGKDAAKAVGEGATTVAKHVIDNPVRYATIGGVAYAWDPVSQAYQVAKEGLGLAKDTLSNPMGNPAPTPEAGSNSAPEQSTGDWLKGIKEKIQDIRKDGLFPWMAGKANDLYSQGESGLNSMLGEGAGRVLMPALGMGALTLGANYLLGGNKKRRYAGGHGQAPVVNVNIGGGGQNPGILNYSRSGVQSLSSPVNLSSSYGMDNKYGMDMVKHASGVTELLTKAVQQRAINKAIDKFQEASLFPQHENSPEEEEIEITSKYPEVAKLLKDEQNKAYLDRILKD